MEGSSRGLLERDSERASNFSREQVRTKNNCCIFTLAASAKLPLYYTSNLDDDNFHELEITWFSFN